MCVYNIIFLLCVHTFCLWPHLIQTNLLTIQVPIILYFTIWQWQTGDNLNLITWMKICLRIERERERERARTNHLIITDRIICMDNGEWWYNVNVLFAKQAHNICAYSKHLTYHYQPYTLTSGISVLANITD